MKRSKKTIKDLGEIKTIQLEEKVIEIEVACDPNNWWEVNKNVFQEMVQFISQIAKIKILLDEASKRYEDSISERYTQGRAAFTASAEQLQEALILMMVVANRCQGFFAQRPDETEYDRFP